MAVNEWYICPGCGRSWMDAAEGYDGCPFCRIATLEDELAEEKRRRIAAVEEFNTQNNYKHSAIARAEKAEAERDALRADNARLREALETTLRALQKAINGNTLDDTWVIAEYQARAALGQGE